MKKIITLSVVGIFLLGLCFTFSLAIKTQEKKSDAQALKILEKMIEATGGRKALEKIKDTTSSGTLSLVSMGLEGGFTFYHKEPNNLRIDAEVMGQTITYAYDGKICWGVNPQSGMTEEMDELQAESFRRDAMGNSALLHPDKFGITFTYKGKEKLEEKDHHVLIQTFPDGWEGTLYINAETFLLYKTTGIGPNDMGVEVEFENFTTDYKEVDGVLIAHTATTYQDGEEYLTLTITETKFNTGIEDSLFVMQ